MSAVNQQSTFEKSNANPAVVNSKPRPVPMILKLLRMAFVIGGTLAPRLTGLGAYKLWFTPTRFQTPASELSALETAKIEQQTINHHKKS